jgi:hypothetical protein
MDAIACKCPTCGAPVPNDAFNFDEETRTFVANGVAVRFTEMETWIIAELWRSRRRGGFRSLEALANATYANDPDGGPDNAYWIISANLGRIRKKLAATGYTIPNGNNGRPRRGFQIIKSEECA